ncbi:tetratricopeptide repeat protein [Acetivibrio cellulolyticus]|uniref:tetratricopeptide repeat protein n=1 Tax=Acetivibrio cellulolyticus TaxID=35830 RepID=UPI0001E2BDB7|nr:cytochrome c biosynthesis protein [Acetivibrio cellulolyticus]
MNKDLEKLNIFVSKYENYVKKNPKQAHGYYCLGWLNLNLAKYKDAQEHFEKAISIDSTHTLSKVGLIVTNVFRRKFVQAVNLYSQYRNDINRKNIFKIKMIRGVSEFYSKDSFFSKKSKETSNPLFYKLTIQPLLARLTEETDNFVLILLLAMYYMSVDERSLDIMYILKVCVYVEAIDDNMRWALIRAIADCGEKLYYDLDIASKFTSIPETDCPDEYVKTIYNTALLGRNKYKVKNIINSMNKSGKDMTLSMAWKYVDWSWNVELYDLSVYECCNRLLMSGWVDIVLLEMMAKLEKQNIITFTDEELSVLKIYDYCT